MERFENSIEVDCPVRTAYNQWTQLEEFPRFMEGIEEVRQLDDAHLRWRATIGGKTKEWDAEITEQVPDQRIAWRATSGAPNAGSVHFEPLAADRTRITLKLAYEPEGLAENVGDLLGVMSRRLERTLADFKRFIEERGRETGGWRGEVHQGRASDEGDRTGGERAPGARGGASRTDRDEAPGAIVAGAGARRRVRAKGAFEPWDEPFGLMRRLWSDMDRMFGRAGWPLAAGAEYDGLWAPHVEVTQHGDELVVTADLPGVKRDDITLEVGDDALILQGERRSEHRSGEAGVFRSECEYGSFYRAIPLPEHADAASAQASMDNGVLKVTLRAPRAAPEGRRVPIRGA